MYWDGCIIDGITPEEGIIISAYHPNSVKILVGIMNQMVDANGNKYKFTLKTWREENISYPK
jgi:bisphosphoglycerate-dependent phosphoglycerate mutase